MSVICLLFWLVKIMMLHCFCYFWKMMQFIETGVCGTQT